MTTMHKDMRLNKPFNYVTVGLMILLLITLNGCSTMHSNKDGPPPYDVDVSNIPDAKPRVEPLSKVGNLPQYRVFGKTYHTMSSSKNYHAVGTASWYGRKFHQHSTSSGEPYDMLGMTAAHKTLPLPTYVQVTNLSNGRKVIVKVNDRGPFEGSRLIDLSYAAAKKLGMLGHGTTKVSVTAIDPRKYNSQPSYYNHDDLYLADNKRTESHYVTHQKPDSTQQTSSVYLQVAAFKNKSNAEKLRKQLSSVVTSPVQITNAKKLYRVQIGPILNKSHVAQINRKLRAMGLSSRQTVV